MSITRAQANTDANTAKDAIQSDSNTQFISDVDSMIQQAISLGQFQVCATTNKNVDLQYIVDYYGALGYSIDFPDMSKTANFPASDLFGQFWIDYWKNNISNLNIKNPTRILIGWQD